MGSSVLLEADRRLPFMHETFTALSETDTAVAFTARMLKVSCAHNKPRMEFTVRLLKVICARKQTVNGAFRSPYIRSSVPQRLSLQFA